MVRAEKWVVFGGERFLQVARAGRMRDTDVILAVPNAFIPIPMRDVVGFFPSERDAINAKDAASEGVFTQSERGRPIRVYGRKAVQESPGWHPTMESLPQESTST